jgi:hypothetical protein
MKQPMQRDRTYIGLHKDGISPTANIILDAQVFSLLPETETCEGWKASQLEALYDKVSTAWAPYGHHVSRLPPELRERHARLYEAAIATARARGWDPGTNESDGD